MVYKVKTSKGYWERRKSVREGKRVRSVFVAYLGKRSDEPDARLAQMLDTAERKAEEVDAMQRERFGETGAERAERVASEARFSVGEFLEETTGPGQAPDEPQTTADQAETEPDKAGQSETTGEPDAEPSEG